MRRIISLFLAVVLIFSVNSMAFAADTVQTEPKLYDEYTISTGVYYSYTLNYDNAEWTAIIFVPNDERDVSFSAVQVNNLSVERQDEENDGIYTITNKIYKHCGLNERNNEVRAYLQEENAELNYYPSSSYYHDYTAQADDAYDLYFGRT